MYFGIQMFGTRPEWQADARGFFAKVKEFGYAMVEPCLSLIKGFDMSGFGFIAPETFINEYLPVIRELGLSVPSVHVVSQNIAADADELPELARAIGNRQFVVGCPRELDRQSLDALAEGLAAAGKRLAAAGCQLLVHNNPPEVLERIDGVTAYEYLVNKAGENVGFQPDLGWIAAGGVDPEEFLWRNEKKIWSIHYKDYSYEQKAEAPIGRGDLDLPACFVFARAHGIPQIADQDSDVMTHAANTRAYLNGLGQYSAHMDSIVCTLDVDTGELTELRRFNDRYVQAPNWLADGDTLLYNAEGRMWKYSISKDTETQLDTGSRVRCSNDHVPSPDGKQVAISEMTPPEGEGWGAWMYIFDLEKGGEGRQVSPITPNWVHGWSPDGGELAYCAVRGDIADVCVMPVEGGAETRLTDGLGYSDGPEYTSDGRHILFNSTREGLMQCYRMDRDGSNLVKLTDDGANNWFPHASPDMRRIVYLTFKQGELEPHEHLPGMNVSLSVMDYDGSNKRKLLDFFGGQGSINVNSWSPDSRRVALVVYELHHK